MRKIYKVSMFVAFDTEEKMDVESVKDYLDSTLILDIDHEGGESVDDEGITASGVGIDWSTLEEVISC